MRISFFSIIFLFILFSHNILSQPDSLKFAWLSDLHTGSQNADEDLRNCVNDINNIPDINFVVITGDITESGKTEDLCITKKILDSLKKKYYILPGNHDTKWSESGCSAFSKIFNGDRINFTYKDIRFLGIHQGPIMRMGEGHFSPEDLRWLDTSIENINNEKIIFITHYPLDSSIDNWYEVTDRLKKINILGAFSGHGHTNLKLDFEGIPGFMGRSILRTSKKNGGYNIVKIYNDSVFITERIPVNKIEINWARERLGYRTGITKYPRPNFNENNNFQNVKAVWTYNSGFTIASGAGLDNNIAFAGNGTGEMIAISLKDGTKVWSFKANNSIYSTPDINNDKIVFSSTDGNIYCLNSNTGLLLWKFETSTPIVASPKIHNGKIFIGSSEGIFRCINLENGKLEWEYKEIKGFIESLPVINNETVFFGAWDSFFYALNINDGNLLWKWTGDKKGVLLSPAACIPVISNNKVFIVAPDRFMTAININSGKNVWRTKDYQVREMIGGSEDGLKVYVRTMNDSVYSFTAIEDKPKINWAANCHYGYDIDPSMPFEKDGTIFFGTQKGYVYALNASDGSIKWKYRTGIALINNVTPVDSKSVIITDSDGKVIYLSGQ